MKAIDIVENETWWHDKLNQSIAYFRAREKSIGLEATASQTAIRSPTVPVSSARLRVTLSADHRQMHITDCSQR